jgi:hypothetical protein
MRRGRLAEGLGGPIGQKVASGSTIVMAVEVWLHVGLICDKKFENAFFRIPSSRR